MSEQEIKQEADRLVEEHIIANAKTEGINLTPELIRQFDNFDEGIYNALFTVNEKIEVLESNLCGHEWEAIQNEIKELKAVKQELENRLK